LKSSFKNKSQSGQSSIEFALIVPLLFLIFFAVIQMAYMGYVALAVQRAALAAAQERSLTGPWGGTDINFKLAYALSPLASFNQATLACVSQSQYSCSISPDQKKVTIQVRYPMPIWVPLADRIFGQPLASSVDSNSTEMGLAIKEAFKLSGKPEPDLSFQADRFPHVFWITFESGTYNEGFTNYMGF
jgi:hypothetical protein